MSYSATLSLLDKISELHTAPLSMWTSSNTPFMFWGDNLDKQRRVCDVRSTRHGALLHMYSILAGCSRTTDPTLCQTGHVASLSSISPNSLLPTHSDFSCIKVNLVVLVARLLTQYMKDLRPFSKSVPRHIDHKYSKEMSQKSTVVVVDVLKKNEACRNDMVDIMMKMQEYLGEEYPSDHHILSGGDQLTCERQIASILHRKDGDTMQERLGIFEPVTSDWHCMVVLLSVSYMCMM